MIEEVKSISIVMPCFNEQEAIPTIIPRTLRCLELLQEKNEIQSFELIVVNDDSTDGSLEQLAQFTKIKVVHTDGKGRGYGKALKAGFRQAEGQWIGFFDVDNSYRPEDLPLFIDEIKKGESDFIMGQRRFNESGMSFTRGFGNWVYVVLAKVFYGSQLEDVCSGYRIFHRRYVNEIVEIPEEGLDFSIYLTLKMITQKTLIKPISIQYDERIGESKLSVFSDGWAFLRVLLTLKFRRIGAFKHSRV